MATKPPTRQHRAHLRHRPRPSVAQPFGPSWVGRGTVRSHRATGEASTDRKASSLRVKCWWNGAWMVVKCWYGGSMELEWWWNGHWHVHFMGTHQKTWEANRNGRLKNYNSWSIWSTRRIMWGFPACHRGTSIAGWFWLGKIPSRNGWRLGVPPWLWKPPCGFQEKMELGMFTSLNPCQYTIGMQAKQ